MPNDESLEYAAKQILDNRLYADPVRLEQRIIEELQQQALQHKRGTGDLPGMDSIRELVKQMKEWLYAQACQSFCKNGKPKSITAVGAVSLTEDMLNKIFDQGLEDAGEAARELLVQLGGMLEQWPGIDDIPWMNHLSHAVAAALAAVMVMESIGKFCEECPPSPDQSSKSDIDA
jgi:hypothetical protein